MRTLPSEVISYLQSNSGIVVRQLLWVSARNRSTGDTETIGFWSGEDHIEFVIDGQTRLYYGAGQFVQYGQVTLESALNVRTLSTTVFPISQEMETLIRQYDPKMAPVETHVALYHPDTNNLVAPPIKMHEGWIDKFPISTPPKGEQATGKLDMVNQTRLLTRRLASRRSNDSQRLRSSTDTFYKDVATTGQVVTPWGSK